MLLDVSAADNGHSWHICHMMKWSPLLFPPARVVERPQAKDNEGKTVRKSGIVC